MNHSFDKFSISTTFLSLKIYFVTYTMENRKKEWIIWDSWCKSAWKNFQFSVIPAELIGLNHIWTEWVLSGCGPCVQYIVIAFFTRSRYPSFRFKINAAWQVGSTLTLFLLENRLKVFYSQDGPSNCSSYRFKGLVE